jgi:nucleosome binding factor SPN SPT16 subunit
LQQVLTAAVSKAFKDVAYFFKDENDDNAPAPKPKAEPKGPAKVVDSKLRSEMTEDDLARKVRLPHHTRAASW